MHWRPQKAFAKQVDFFPGTSIDYMEHAHRERLNRRKYLQCPAYLFSISTVQTTKNAHGCLLTFPVAPPFRAACRAKARRYVLQEQPHGERPGEQHQRCHDDANLEVVEPRHVDIAMAQDE